MVHRQAIAADTAEEALQRNTNYGMKPSHFADS